MASIGYSLYVSYVIAFIESIFQGPIKTFAKFKTLPQMFSREF